MMLMIWISGFAMIALAGLALNKALRESSLASYHYRANLQKLGERAELVALLSGVAGLLCAVMAGMSFYVGLTA